MDTQHRIGLSRLVGLLLVLGLMCGLQGSGYGQETLPKVEVGTVAAEEVERLNATIDKLSKEGKYAEALLIAQRGLTLVEQAWGTTHPNVVTSLNKLAMVYYHQEQYAEAAALYQRALRIREQVLGPIHPDVATSLTVLALVYEKQGRYTEAVPLYQRALRIREQVLGPIHPDVATSLTVLALVYTHQQQYTEAAPLLQRALGIQEQVLGPTHPKVGSSLTFLAQVYTHQQQYSEAIPLLQRTLHIQKQALGASHPDLAATLTALAALYKAQGQDSHPDLAATLIDLVVVYRAQQQYSEAIPLLQRALHIQEQALGVTHPHVATSLYNLASLYTSQGQYAEAIPLAQRAIDIIQEQAPASNHPDLATMLHGLAVLYAAQGQYAKAVPLLQRALSIQEQTLGSSHLHVAATLHSLAQCYSALEQPAEAVPLLQRALSIQEQTLGASHPDVAATLQSLAVLYKAQGRDIEAVQLSQRVLRILEQDPGATHPDMASLLKSIATSYLQGQRAEALSLYQQALPILEKTRGASHPDIAVFLNHQANIYVDQGQFAEAIPLLQRALNIQEQALGPGHPDVATTLNNLAMCYYTQHQYAEAIALFQRALNIQEHALGATHRDVAITLDNLAVLSLTQGDYAHAVQLLTQSSDISEHALTRTLILGTEAQKLASAGMFSAVTDAILSLHTGYTPHDPQALRLALTTVLRRKGRVLDAMTDTVATLRRRIQPEDQQLLAQWAAVRGELATLMFKGPRAQPPETYRAQLAQLESQAQQLEAQLSVRSAAFRTQTQPVTLAQVQAAIPEGAVLVELAVYTPFTPPQQWGTARYVAYVLPHQGDPSWVDLGEAAAIEQAVQLFGDNLSSSDSLQVMETARALDKLLMQPIRPLLGPVRHVLLAPDGVLNLIPFGALVDETQHYLLERFTISYLTTGRDLLRSPSQRPALQPPLVVGNPDFDTLKPSAGRQGAAATPTSTARRSANGQTLHWRPLPYTAQEVAAVQRLLPGSQLWTGIAASEAALKQVQGPRLLHLATHGFFLADQSLSSRSTPAVQVASATLLIPPPEPQNENPLLRSGLVLAGANVLQAGPEDGHLTALEVAGLDLWGTELVVLSACDTGLGKASTGEGVYGLRRALVMAGADSQVMSLWQVADKATRELMVAYYRRLLAGEGRAEALRQAQLAMLANPQQQHPFYWAAFILSGAWTPLTHR